MTKGSRGPVIVLSYPQKFVSLVEEFTSRKAPACAFSRDPNHRKLLTEGWFRFRKCSYRPENPREGRGPASAVSVPQMLVKG